MHLCLINLINDQPHIRIVETTPEVNDHEQVKFLHDKYVADGYEGLILRTEHGEYTFNERSKSLLKVKQYQDEEFLIIGSEIDENKDIAKSFVFVLKNNINDLTFKARPTGSNEQKYLWYAKPQLWINKKATVRFFERSKDGLPQQGSVQHKLTEVLHVRPKGE
jgi:ATP-dependent DNA ligase